MSTQIAVRLSDDLVDFVDQLVADGSAKSRAGVVAMALEREQRRRIYERDLEILESIKDDDDDDDLAGFIEYTSRRPMPDLD